LSTEYSVLKSARGKRTRDGVGSSEYSNGGRGYWAGFSSCEQGPAGVVVAAVVEGLRKLTTDDVAAASCDDELHLRTIIIIIILFAQSSSV